MGRHSTDAVFQASGRPGEGQSGGSMVATLLDAEVMAGAEESASLEGARRRV